MNSIFMKILLTTFAGLIAGTLVLGLAGRFLMRLIAILNDTAQGFSWGGTIEVILLGSIIGSVAGLFYGFFRSSLKVPVLLKGLIMGILTYVAVLLLPVQGKGAALGFPDLQVFIYLGFALLFIVFGICLALLNTVFVRSTNE